MVGSRVLLKRTAKRPSFQLGKLHDITRRVLSIGENLYPQTYPGYAPVCDGCQCFPCTAGIFSGTGGGAAAGGRRKREGSGKSTGAVVAADHCIQSISNNRSYFSTGGWFPVHLVRYHHGPGLWRTSASMCYVSAGGLVSQKLFASYFLFYPMFLLLSQVIQSRLNSAFGRLSVRDYCRLHYSLAYVRLRSY